jgi:hypothetical protein
MMACCGAGLTSTPYRLERTWCSLLLAPFAPAMRPTVPYAATLSPLGAVLQLTLPPAHRTPAGSTTRRRNPNSLQRTITAVIHPLSVLNTPLVLDTTHTTVVEVRRCSMSRSTWSTALGRGTYGGCVVGEDGQDSSALSTVRFAGCLPVVPLLQTLMVGSNTRHSTPLHAYTASTARRRDTLAVLRERVYRPVNWYRPGCSEATRCRECAASVAIAT